MGLGAYLELGAGLSALMNWSFTDWLSLVTQESISKHRYTNENALLMYLTWLQSETHI